MSLAIGTKAPNFRTIDQFGKTVSLEDFKGKKIVLYFYPKDNTPGCTAQACNLAENYTFLQEKGYIVLGVSIDTQKSHAKFAEKFNLPFQLLVDDAHEIVNLYGVWAEKNMYGRKYMGIVRTTFIIDENGIIADIIEKVDTKNHTKQIII